jgi:hypothetical protein
MQQQLRPIDYQTYLQPVFLILKKNKNKNKKTYTIERALN